MTDLQETPSMSRVDLGTSARALDACWAFEAFEAFGTRRGALFLDSVAAPLMASVAARCAVSFGFCRPYPCPCERDDEDEEDGATELIVAGAAATALFFTRAMVASLASSSSLDITASARNRH